MAGRSMAKEEPRHTAARSLPFPQPQLFPAAPSPSTTVSPSLAGFLLPEVPPLPQGSTAPGPLPSPPLEGILGARGACQRGLMPAGPGAGAGAWGAWERVPAPALPLCLHVTFPVWRKWCRGEVPAGTGRHVTGLQPLLERAGGNPEHCRESSPRTLFPSSVGRLLQHPPCSLGSAPHPHSCVAPSRSWLEELTEGTLLGLVGVQELTRSQQRAWSRSRQGAARLPLFSRRHKPWCGWSSLSCQHSWLLIWALSSYLCSSKGEGERGVCAASSGHERSPVSKSLPPQAPVFPALPSSKRR